MMPGNATILVCPLCGGEKEILNLMSGNSFGSRQWWDLRQDCPMLPRVSYVQRCPHCGKYYMTAVAQHKEGTEWSFELGALSYPEMRQAWSQLKDELQLTLRIFLLREYVWTYNDTFQRENYTD